MWRHWIWRLSWTMPVSSVKANGCQWVIKMWSGQASLDVLLVFYSLQQLYEHLEQSYPMAAEFLVVSLYHPWPSVQLLVVWLDYWSKLGKSKYWKGSDNKNQYWLVLDRSDPQFFLFASCKPDVPVSEYMILACRILVLIVDGSALLLVHMHFLVLLLLFGMWIW